VLEISSVKDQRVLDVLVGTIQGQLSRDDQLGC